MSCFECSPSALAEADHRCSRGVCRLPRAQRRAHLASHFSRSHEGRQQQPGGRSRRQALPDSPSSCLQHGARLGEALLQQQTQQLAQVGAQEGPQGCHQRVQGCQACLGLQKACPAGNAGS